MEEKDIVRKIDESFGEDSEGSEITMCYVTSEIMYRLLEPDFLEIKFYDTDKFYDFMMKYPILNIELTLTSKNIFDNAEKNKLIKQFGIDKIGYANSVFKYAKLRIFMHAFNIIKVIEGYLWAQSWFNIQTYGIRKKFATEEEYGFYIMRLIDAINNFNKDPEDLYTICFYGKEIDSNTKKILKMVTDTKMQYDILLKCNY
uniref:Uncharacterized protein n=1 Tax=viral metagenome TaxID=1070528 RepID=A0A6C0C6G0_9ZZZZ